MYIVALILCMVVVVVVCRSMQVRGAPLIALVACLGLSVQLKSKQDSFKDIAEAKTFILDSIVMLRESRPTAVNLFVATDELR
jgi:methylthioribose-1-phosphate isomerase